MRKQDMVKAKRIGLSSWSMRSLLWLAGVAVALGGRPVWAKPASISTTPSATASQLAQASLVEITNIQLEATETGLQVVLETAGGELPAPATSISGNALILEISSAVLAGETFEQFTPAEGIAVVQVSALTGDRVQVAITGTDAVPTADVSTDAAGLTLSVVPGIAQVGAADEPLRLVVTGDGDEGYSPFDSSTATGTDTPLRDIPLSIQVIPRAVLDDRNVTELGDALETAGGVLPEEGRGTSGSGPFFRIRGFGASIFRDGVETFTIAPLTTNDIERVEVLKGPASVLLS